MRPKTGLTLSGQNVLLHYIVATKLNFLGVAWLMSRASRVTPIGASYQNDRGSFVRKLGIRKVTRYTQKGKIK